MPLERTSTGSPTDSAGNSTSPRTRSVKRMGEGGMRSRTAKGSPAPARCADSGPGMERQRPL
jgi:hypothetical protein